MDTSSRKKHPSAEREKFQSLHGLQKVQYIWDYYKLPLAVCGIILYILAYSVYGKITHKEVVLYTALVNVAAGEEMTQDLSIRFLEAEQISPIKNKLYLHSGLYLTDDENNAYHEYTYASRMKILAAIDAEQMDVVLMNREAFDAFSQNGYLCDLKELLSSENPGLYEELTPYLVENTAILEDNAIDLYFDDSAAYQAKTTEYAMGLDLSASPVIKKAGFAETVYLGVISNSPRKAVSAAYLQYLYHPFSS